jgi:hypothetical protein
MWLVVFAAVVLGAAIGALTVFGGTVTYTAKATFYVTPPTSSTPTDAVMGDQYATNRAQLYLELIKSDELARRVAASLKTTDAPDVLASRISATSLHQTPILTIQTTGSTPDAAQSLAKAYVAALPEYAKSVEQNSGLRDAVPLAPVVLPIDVSSNLSGFTPWIRVALWAAIFGIPVLAVLLWIRHRHPVVGDLHALRKAVPVPVVEDVGNDPNQLARVRSLLLAAPGSKRRLFLCSPRASDTVEEFSDEFVRSLQRDGIVSEHVNAADLGELNTGVHSSSFVIVDAPGLLDENSLAVALADRSTMAVILARSGRTLLEDVIELHRYLKLSGVGDIGGVLLVHPSGRARNGARRRVEVGVSAEEHDHPWPKIDVLEAELGKSVSGVTND